MPAGVFFYPFRLAALARFPLLSPTVTFSPGRGKSVLKGAPFGNAGKFAATAEAVPLDRLSPAGERCRVSDRVGSGWLRT